MDRLVRLRMKKPTGVVRQIVAQILLGELNIDQAAERLKINRQLVQHWVEKIEDEVDASKRPAPIDTSPPPQPTPTPRRTRKKKEPEVDELRAKVQALEEQLEVANFKALYYSTLVRVAKYELGVDVEKKPPWRGPLPSHPVHVDESCHYLNSSARGCAASAVRLALPGRATINIGNGRLSNRTILTCYG